MMKWLEQYMDFAAAPAVALLLTYYQLDVIRAHPALWLGLFALGFVTWTLAEYSIHRWVLHWFWWHGTHEAHHKDPREVSRFPIWLIPSYLLGAFVLFWCVSGGVPMFVGFLVGYFAFICSHAVYHFFPRLTPALAMQHNAHHKLTNVNFGMVTTLWDRVFGTYMPRGRGRDVNYPYEPMEHV